jgi:hypothetical protein
MSNEELKDRAIRRYARYCRESGFNYQQPAEVEITARRVVLKNVNGVLAVFRRTKNDRLMIVKP